MNNFIKEALRAEKSTAKEDASQHFKNNAQTCFKSKLRAALLSGLSCGQSRTPARTVFIRDVANNTKNPKLN
ncbi:hypothetical protein LB465_02820 [Salegentibacter sp. LM13S]|uniref:hypothetical protein n=1 Tax=Salegentibacter lacus TaxID=2873599 RepID=UPI001CCA9576|nr:hypothetical protein [Salegentibacter lacus]MBZ9629698.1 hypothetical protein [Salegentibacter lacus]